jgi:glycosyltransferase involved in cell wall biosynthesis
MWLQNPKWIDQNILHKKSPDDFPDDFFIQANERLSKLISDDPVVSVIIVAYNEEANIVRCLDSLSRSQSEYPIEIIVVDNNSSDKTASMIQKFNVRYVFQKIQGCGPARQAGLENARGKYVLTGDADTLYPPKWINKMVKKLKGPGISCVYGRYSFISDENTPRWKLALYERLSDGMMMVKSFKRPYLSALGMTMGYLREYGLKAGYTFANVRGEDGRMCFDLMKFGKVKFILNPQARVWTGTRTISKDGKLWDAVKKRVVMALANIHDLFTKPKDHDTKTSPSSNYDYKYNLNKLKRKVGIKSK